MKSIEITINLPVIPDEQFCWNFYWAREEYYKTHCNDYPGFLYLHPTTKRKIIEAGFDIEKEFDVSLMVVDTLTPGKYVFGDIKVRVDDKELWNAVIVRDQRLS